jgi:hypothetical protein
MYTKLPSLPQKKFLYGISYFNFSKKLAKVPLQVQNLIENCRKLGKSTETGRKNTTENEIVDSCTDK